MYVNADIAISLSVSIYVLHMSMREEMYAHKRKLEKVNVAKC